MIIRMSSGHSTKCQGAVGLINEVEEATRVVDGIEIALEELGVDVETFHDTISTTQNENLNRIVDWHNSEKSDLAVSVHFNAFEPTAAPRGVEVLWVSQDSLAEDLAEAISNVSGLINRGAKFRDDLFVLNETIAPCVLLEIAFVDSEEDVRLYKAAFDEICTAIAYTLLGREFEAVPPGEFVPPEPAVPPAGPTPRVDITVEGEVLIFVNGLQVGTKG